MEIRTNQDIISLIECRKVLRAKPSKQRQVNQSFSQSLNLYCEDSDIEFDAFIAQSVKIPEDFSLGLMYDNNLLIRVNGFHGTTKAGFFSSEHHAHPHAHILTIDDINNARQKKPSQILDLTGEFIDIKTAMLFFFRKCAIINYEEYFDFNQMSLF